MKPLPAEVAQAVQKAGILVNNNFLVESLRQALASGQHAYKMVPGGLQDVLEEDAWIDRQDRNGKRYTFGPGEFTRFIEEPMPKGLGSTKDEIRKYLGPSNNSLRNKFETLAEAGPGAPLGNTNNLSGTKKNREQNPIPNVVRDWVPDTIPMPKLARDRSHEPKAGNSVGYAVRRLERESKKDPQGLAAVAYERLRAGELSANAAAVAAGHRKKLIAIPTEPEGAARLLAQHFRDERLGLLIASLESYRVRDHRGPVPQDGR